MIDVGLALGWFVVSALTDYLSVLWQEARESRRAARCANIAVALEVVTWGAVLFAVAGYWIVIASGLAGSWLGSYVGVRRASAKEG